MFIIDDIISWIVGKVMDRFFSNKKENEELLLLRNERLKLHEKINQLQSEKNTITQDLTKEKESKEQEKKKFIDFLKRRGISTDKLIERYDKPLMAILISYASQKERNAKGSCVNSAFLRTELEKYNSKYLGGTDALIPPAKVPTWIKDQNDLKKWFEKDILKNRHCKIKFLTLIDLKKKTIWGKYLPYEQKKPKHFSIGEVLDIEDIFTEEQINKISISQIIRDGDIGWLASSILPEKELDELLKNQKIIEKELGNLSLRELADDSQLTKIEEVLKPIISKPQEVAKAIIEEAKYWEQKLK